MENETEEFFKFDGVLEEGDFLLRLQFQNFVSELVLLLLQVRLPLPALLVVLGVLVGVVTPGLEVDPEPLLRMPLVAVKDMHNIETQPHPPQENQVDVLCKVAQIRPIYSPKIITKLSGTRKTWGRIRGTVWSGGVASITHLQAMIQIKSNN